MVAHASSDVLPLVARRGRRSERVAEYRIERDIDIEAPVDVVWRTITQPDDIARWFADRVELELKPGGRGYLGFDRHGEHTGTAIVVETVDPPHRFAFRWNRPQDGDRDLGTSVLVDFTLEPRGAERTQ